MPLSGVKPLISSSLFAVVVTLGFAVLLGYRSDATPGHWLIAVALLVLMAVIWGTNYAIVKTTDQVLLEIEQGEALREKLTIDDPLVEAGNDPEADPTGQFPKGFADSAHLSELLHAAGIAHQPAARGDLDPGGTGAAAQPLLQDGRRRRQHEDADRLDPPAAHLPRPLHVDDEHHVLAARKRRRHHDGESAAAGIKQQQDGGREKQS